MNTGEAEDGGVCSVCEELDAWLKGTGLLLPEALVSESFWLLFA